MEQKVYVSVVHVHVLDRYTASLPGSYRLKFAVAVARRFECLSSNFTATGTLSRAGR